MHVSNFLFEEYVDQNLFNSAMSNLLSSMREMGANGTFFIPGVINPASLTFSFNSTLVVTATFVNTGVNAFKCLFQSGAICSAHGIVNGVDNPVYSLDFAPFAPFARSATVYVVAAYTQVQESITTILGPPVGHPDYSSNFNPYNGYTVLQDTLNVFITTTEPDNLVNIELARVTLTAGQGIVSALDTTHQVLAKVNATFVAMSGDVIGNSNNNSIQSWQGNPIALSSPLINSYPLWNGSSWVSVAAPTDLPPSGPAGNDLSGFYPNPTVLKSSAPTFTARNIAASGFVQGVNATLTNQAVMLGQLAASFSNLSLGTIATAGDIYHNYFTIPVYNINTSSFTPIYFIFGFYSIYNTSNNLPALFTAAVTYPVTLPHGLLFCGGTLASNKTSSFGAFNGAGCAVETADVGNSSATFFIDRALPSTGGSVKVAGPTQDGILGFWWFVCGS